MQRTNWNALITTAALALTFLGASAVAAPRNGGHEQSTLAARKEAPPDTSIYRVHYMMNEIENRKTINSRSYTLMAQPGKNSTVRIGSRVPYSTGKDIQYQDVGMSIDCTIYPHQQEGKFIVGTTLSMNNVAGKEAMPTGGTNPIFGRVTLLDYTSATLGKPTFVGSIDDVASSRHYVVEVTVTKAP